MKQRIITALVLAPLAIAGIFLLPLKFFMMFTAAIFLLASKEWASFVNSDSTSSPILYIFGFVLAITLILLPIEQLWNVSGIHPMVENGLIVTAAWWFVSLVLVATYPKSGPYWARSKAVKALFGLLTLIPFFWSMVVLRSVNIHHDFYYGGALLLFVFLLVWAADTGAYFCGKRFGKHKLAPNVSPGKTIEGFVGGAVSAMIVAFLASIFFAVPGEKVVMFFVAALITTFVSALGDLSESIFKREARLKDSGNLLPGHGGILDRIDSLTAAVPVFTLTYLLWLN
ncbi:phosphatidate cytidylyltransferase [Psychromonas sp. psych-6C06]|uniref:phosphatidate cytidylyltransferase n=1 Tax=Psychromonas sp. psych-6C06 TaxID=2058089 RepID=UPI000C32B65C|nr:phosphatidate cytidylyltransferase [Psychromonas sp. psych-6C06]PKF62877.1 phosphatidate cytidylyltransferase [Psychromonas sp. psych-6C06]